MRRIALFLMIALPLLATAEVYRWKDKQGNIVFSDQPPAGRKADTVPLSNPNVSSPTDSAKPVKTPEATKRAETPRESDAAKSGYSVFKVRSPQSGETLRANDGNVDVNFDLEPPLQAELGHRFRFLLDGQPLQEGVSPFVVLRNLDRGTHTVQALVITADGATLAQTDAVEFHLHRHSLMH